MADRKQELPLLPEQGMAPDAHGQGPYIQNMERLADRLTTRKGFGQVSQFDTTLAAMSHQDATHLGSAVIRTDFGHEQIVTVKSEQVFTGGLTFGTEAKQIGIDVPTYLVTIYDVTDDSWWEEVLHIRTSEQIIRNDKRQAVYETDRDVDAQAPLRADTEEWFFVEFNDVLYMGSRRAGLWAYNPSVFNEPRTQQINSIDHHDWNFKGYGESAVVTRVAAAPGLFADAYAYLTGTEFPRPTDAAALLGRLVLVDGRTLYFSDINRPTSVIADNVLTVPGESNIKAVEELGGNLVILTETETWLYMPPAGGQVVSGGRLIRTSNAIGAEGPNAVDRGDGLLFWMDRNGIYATADGVTLEPIAVGWEDFFRRHVTNPLSQFFQESGLSSLVNAQPRLQHKYSATRATVVWDHVRKRLIVTFPTEAISLVLEDGFWSVFNYESTAEAASSVATDAFIPGPWPVMGREDLYIVAAFDTPSLTDDSQVSGGGSPSGETSSPSSHVILRYGHGGNLDRSIDYEDEDARRFVGKHHSSNETMNAQDGRNTVYIGEPIPVPVGFAYPNSAKTGAVGHYLFPIEVAPDDTMTTGPDEIDIRFDFDNTHWTPIIRSGDEVDFLLPPERAESAPGYKPGAPTAGVAEVQVYDKGTDQPDNTGEQIRIRWDGSQAGYAAAIHAPKMNLTQNCRNRLIYIPMRYTGDPADDTFQQGFLGIRAQIISSTAPFTLDCEFIAWQQALHMDERHVSNDVAQAVDWIVKSDQLGLKDGGQIKARTVYLKARSMGEADTQIPSSTVHGLLNVLWGSDYKGWAAQVVDHGGNLERAASVDTLRSRMSPSSGTIVDLVYNGATTEWGNRLDVSDGNVLIADRPLDTIAVSDSVKGEHVSIMLFGHVRNRAERLEVGDAKLAIVPTGGRRRTGR